MIDDIIKQHGQAVALLGAQRAVLEEMADRASACLARGNKILLMGNGGSAADAQHIAAELVGRFQADRGAFAALALTTDTSILTSVGNDYGFEAVFARQIDGLARRGDVVIGISTSGNSPNVVRAMAAARRKGCVGIGLLGEPGELAQLVQIALTVPGMPTARVQETHILAGHILCELVEARLG